MSFLAGAAYFVVTHAVFWFQSLISASKPAGTWVALSSADTISLLTGSITAAGLSALYMQARQAREEAEQRASDAAYEAAMRADVLHAEFNTPEMRRYRSHAYEYLKFVKASDRVRALFAEYWVLEKVGSAPIPWRSNRSERLAFSDYDRAVSSMFAFFVRVETHFRTHECLASLTPEDRRQLMGHFHWGYWVAVDILELVDACEKIYDANRATAPERPYFIDPLRSLHTRYKPTPSAAGTAAAE